MVRGDVSTEFLKKLYIEKKLSLPQIAKLTNFPACSICYRFKKENVKLRTISEGTKLAIQRPEVRERISKTWFKRDNIPWNKGKEHIFVKGEKNPMKRPEVKNKVMNNSNVKKTQFKKGSIPWNKNKEMSDNYREKISKTTKKAMKNPEIRKKVRETQFRIGHISWNKGKPWPEEFKKKQSRIQKELIKNNPEILKKSLTFRRPNKTEKELDFLLQKHFPNEFKFVGDGSFVIEGLNPDWINCNGKKLIIELFGEHWHELGEESMRKKIFAKYGFKTLVIWWKETRNKEKVISKIKSFLNNSNVDGNF